MKKNIIIPLGGIGNRFQEAHYSVPKPLIKVFGKSIIEWVIDSINISEISHIIIPYHRKLSNYNFESYIRKIYPNHNFFFYCIKQNTKGAAETIFKVLNEYQKINPDMIKYPIISLDGDNFYTSDILKMWNGENLVFTFKDYQENPIYSYVKTNNINDHKPKLIDIEEKVKISNLACTGAYAFSSGKVLLEYCDKVIINNNIQKGELYISSVIKSMVKDRFLVNIKIINEAEYKCLGTPLQIRLFVDNNTNLIPKKTYCFDLDNTLVSFPTISGDYSTVKPIQKTIDLVRNLYESGNTIIIYTARGMKTMGGDQGKVMANIGKITFDTLESFNIPYHKICFGKPNADFYIDDLGVNSFHDLEKELGYYKNSVECRSFHSVGINSMNVYHKEGDDLSGEIYYYQNIPGQFTNLFPRMINHDIHHNKWFTMEKIDGIVFSNMYLSRELKLTHLDNLLEKLDKMHSYSKPMNNTDNSVIEDTDNDDRSNMYCNYLNKLESRYLKEDYSIYPQSNKVYNELKKDLISYQQQDKGVLGMIHGDPVFTNIMIDKYNNIKMFDIRGKLGCNLSIYGDIFYDYAKIYQSLIGYDEIMKGVHLNENYKREFIEYFEKYIINKFGNDRLNLVKMITKSLLFTLLPLHNDMLKCMDYYKLIDTL
jgi:capsule biosynthesis phosphatase